MGLRWSNTCIYQHAFKSSILNVTNVECMGVCLFVAKENNSGRICVNVKVIKYVGMRRVIVVVKMSQYNEGAFMKRTTV